MNFPGGSVVTGRSKTFPFLSELLVTKRKRKKEKEIESERERRKRLMFIKIEEKMGLS